MKKILSVFLGLATILSLGFTSAFADPSAAEPDIGTDADGEITVQENVPDSAVSGEEKVSLPNGIGDIPVPITEAQQISDAMEQNLSSTQILQIQQKLNNVIPSDFVDPRTANAAWTWYYLVSDYHVYVQERPTWCMAACAQSTLEYLTGSAPTQQAAAAGIGIVAGSGGNMYSLTAYYNNMQNVNGYVYKPNTTSKGEMLSNMYLGITYYDAPITAGIVVNDSNEEWPYTTTGHATVVRGIRSDNQLVQLADPGVKYWNSTLNSYFMVSSDELYKAISYSSKCGYIY